MPMKSLTMYPICVRNVSEALYEAKREIPMVRAHLPRRTHART
jgi:hypothetical protein